MHLVLFFTRSVSLARWKQSGSLGRETALYRKMLPHLDSITFVTYGGPEDLELADRITGVHILCNRWRLPKRLYAFLLPFLFFRHFQTADLFKTNQLHGSDVALWSSLIHRKPLIVRAGYMWPLNYVREHGAGLRTRIMDRVAATTLAWSNKVIFTTQEMKQYAIHHYRVPAEKIVVNPNYVDTDLFYPDPTVKKTAGQILFVGRLNAVKNIDLLISAVSQLPNVQLVIVGKGEDQQALEQQAIAQGANVRFMGFQPNEKLPQFMNQSEIYVLSSKFEGHPKTLIEAMGCGTAVIGTDVEGIKTVITDRLNGRLCQPTVESIAATLSELLADSVERERLGASAHRFVQDNYAIDQIIRSELAVYKTVLGGNSGV